jgi:tetratricopeptide (TPR) repeat protein
MSDEKTQQFLVVDSNQNNALFWEMTIAEGFGDAKVATCAQGYDAIDQAKTTKFDFFVASWDLEPMSGMVLMQKLKEMHRYKNVPYLLFSQVLTEQDVLLAQDFGISNYLVKPFEKAKVIEKIKEMISAEAGLDQNQKSMRKIEDWIQEGKVNEALKLLNPLLEKKGPHLARAHALNGDLWSRTEKLDKAEAAYKSALAIEAGFPAALSGLGKLYIRLKKFDEGLKILEDLHQKSPKNMMKMVNLGGAYLDSGNDAKAEEIFKKVGAIDNENGDAKAGLGKIEFNRGGFENAAKLFRESGKGDELASYFNTLGISKVAKGKFDEGVQVYKNAMMVLPEKDKFHLLEFNIALAFRKANRFGEAANAFARSVIALPSYEKAKIGLLACAEEAKRANQALDEKVIKKALSLLEKPADPVAVASVQVKKAS